VDYGYIITVIFFLALIGLMVKGVFSYRQMTKNSPPGPDPYDLDAMPRARATMTTRGPRVVQPTSQGRGSSKRKGKGKGKGKDKQPAPLPPEATLTFAAERKQAGLDEIFAGLDRELVGLVPIKEKIAEIGSLLLVDQARQRFGLQTPRPNLHMCFTGQPGTGKTTVALRMADLLHKLGYLERGHLVHAMRDDLVGEYIGQTAPRTKRVLERAMGGVLFIDEAYYLYRAGDSKDYGQEVVDILLQVMENDRDKLVVILAGYKEKMDEFFEVNPGMRSRIAHHLDFAAYDPDELVAIGRMMLDQSNYYLSPDAEAEFREYLNWRMRQPHFANARSVRNELERARLRHAHRLTGALDQHWGRDDLMRLERADMLGWPGTAPGEAGASLAKQQLDSL
jgi:probable Rubsico expression protein CbbX